MKKYGYLFTCHHVGRGVDGLGSMGVFVEGLHSVLLLDQKRKVEEILHRLLQQCNQEDT